MSRKKSAPKRVILPDPLFKSELLAKFINRVMERGKKAVAEKIVYDSLEKAMKSQRKSTDDGKDVDIRADEVLRGATLKFFEEVLEGIKPTVEVRSRRIGGATYQVPVEVPSNRKVTLAMRWLVESAKKRSEKTMNLKLANEMLDAINGRGGAVKKRETAHSMAKANQAFAHFRW